MLKSLLIHPEITAILARAGHHGKILIADGNYPASSKKGPNATVVSLNLMPGVVTCAQVLRAVLSAVPIEAIQTMQSETSGPYALSEDPPVWKDYEAELRNAESPLKLEAIEKWAFYEAVATADHILTVQTADQQRYANILLSIGVRMD
ncbi:MAG: RbsD/FucU family protein [Pirellulales bacterium]